MVPLVGGTGVDQGFHHRRLITWGCSRDRHKLAGGVVSRLPIKWQLRMQGVLIASALIALVFVGQFFTFVGRLIHVKFHLAKWIAS